MSLFALLGLSNLIICFMGMVVLVRYRTLIPFMYALFLVQQVSRHLVLQFLPIARSGTSPASAITLPLLGVRVVGLALAFCIRHGAMSVSALIG